MAIAERELTAPNRKKTWQPEPEASEEFAPHPYRWTCEQFHAIGEEGWFDGQRVILMEGEIIAMPPVGDLHCGIVTLASEAFRSIFGAGFFVREEKTFDVGRSTDPQPDIVVVAGTIRDYINRGPTEAALVVEVSNSTLLYDRREKASFYAAAGITDYWIINIAQQPAQVEVYRQPREDTTQPYGFGYAEVTVHGTETVVQPLAAPRPVAVAALLP